MFSSLRWTPENLTIRSWMYNRLTSYVDECGDINCTALVEAWDNECSTGEATLDPDHVAWEIAANLAERFEKEKK